MKSKLSIITLISLALGIIFGLCFPGLAPAIKFIGTYYITILKYMVVPVVITTISVSIYNSSKLKNKLVPITLLVFVLMICVTFATLVLVGGMRVGAVTYSDISIGSGITDNLMQKLSNGELDIVVLNLPFKSKKYSNIDMIKTSNLIL